MKSSQLINLYNLTSKHSSYQILARRLRDYIPTGMLETCSRYEQERLDYILQYVSCENIAFSDIGGNTGFFTFEILDHGAKTALLIEGNQAHSAFVKEAASVLGWQDRVKVESQYMTFENDLSSVDVDVCLLLNVLHHVGDDYGNPAESIRSAKQAMLASLSSLAAHADYLVFQLGFNWKGNRELPLFENGTKKELIEFIESGITNSWTIQAVGVAESSDVGVVYKDLNSSNIQRQDILGEFLNRPLFIMKSKLR